jgi:ParB family chromosome partitioning protein|tara:strand:+ start:27208 stop:28062 length:855 start_codon:yes stop_codon:yes gene_type:complete
MSKDKSSLGTGLDSLLGDRTKTDSPSVSDIATEDLSPGQFQPRKKMYKSTLEELAESIKEQGVLQPLVVRRQASGRFEIVVGERRWRAAQIAGLSTVPAIVRELDNDESAKIALIENIQREDLNALDQARGLQRLQREFNLSQEALARSVGKSRPSVTNLLRLLNLVPEVQALLEDSKIEMGHARALLSADQNKQLQLANEVIKKSLSVRQTEALVGSKKTPTPTKVNQTKDPNTKKLERDLSEALGAEVAIKHNKKGKGVLSISFENLDALDGLLAKIKSKKS